MRGTTVGRNTLAERESDEPSSYTVYHSPLTSTRMPYIKRFAIVDVRHRLMQSAPNRVTVGDRFGDQEMLMTGSLTARKVATAKAGKYSDGGNLYLLVSETGAKKWVMRFTFRGRAREMGLGSATVVSLADARDRASEARRKIASGVDPISDRKRDAGIPTFGQMADQVCESLSAGFRNEKHRAQWKMTLEVYAAPLRSLPSTP